MAIPIIDIFAGPGGLGEGFCSLRTAEGRAAFRIALSIEKDAVACRTLKLRSIRRALADSGTLLTYFRFLRGEIDRAAFDADSVVAEARIHADAEVVNAELGKVQNSMIDDRILEALKGTDAWLLIGGPPCQAYSLAGRSRRVHDITFEDDEKHFLYREYLRILRVHRPPVFVMENVKGLLSSSHGGQPMFSRIRSDLERPDEGLRYRIHSLVKEGEGEALDPRDFVIASEEFGVPQTRHRVILFGIREDVFPSACPNVLKRRKRVSVLDAIGDLPHLRSRLSKPDEDSRFAWIDALKATRGRVKSCGMPGEVRLLAAIDCAIGSAALLEDVGRSFIRGDGGATNERSAIRRWLHVPSVGGVIQHESRSHMPSDLARYMFVSAYAREFGVSPTLRDFPVSLLPNHVNAKNGADGSTPFSDRFRVQCADAPASTIVSHIAKDGHHFIHYDPSQCRSLTVREAARLQTFPDDYFFEGNRTQQYVQVGNAVPPLLAVQIAAVVSELFEGGQHADTNGSVAEVDGRATAT